MLGRYEIDQLGQPGELDQLAELMAHAFGGSVIFTAVHPDKLQVLGYGTAVTEVTTDWGKLTAASPAQTSGCRHNVLGRGKVAEPLLFTDTANDWRMKYCPIFTTGGGPISWYATTHIGLEGQSGHTLPIGSVCVLKFGDNIPAWTQHDTDVLAGFASRIADELAAKHARSQARPRALGQSDHLDAFLRDELIGSHTGSPASDTVVASQPSVAMTAILDLQDDRGAVNASARTHDVYDRFVRRAGALLGADGLALLDVRDLRRAPPKMDAVRRGLARHESQDSGAARASLAGIDTQEAYRISILGVVASEAQAVGAFEARVAERIASLREAVRRGARAGPDEVAAAFGALVPAGSRSTVVVPVYDKAGVALVALAWSSRREAFLASDHAFVEQLATLSHASLTKQRHALATRDNLAFISHISHELRTPIHGLTGELHLLRDVQADLAREGGCVLRIEPLLAEAERCLIELRGVVDDALMCAELGEVVSA